MDLAAEILAGNRRALAKAITLIENEEEEKYDILAKLYHYAGKAKIIGVTGSPGAGKSSLVEQLTREFRKQGLQVGIIAVDPTSPFSGGALLGDRIRMQEHALDEGVFIRSMGTRGSLGGLARSTKEVITLLDAFHFDIILVETVGVGQSELDIMHAVDTVLVVLTPGAGDVIQTLKAGIMEIADVFVINKADLAGADKVVTEVQNMLDLAAAKEWQPPTVKTDSLSGSGISDLIKNVESHQQYLEETERLQKTKLQRLHTEVMEIVLGRLHKVLAEQFQANEQFKELLNQVGKREVDPYTAARLIIKTIESVNLSSLA